MKVALDEYVIRGVRNNVNFLRDVLDQPRFVEGRLTTKYIPEEYPDGYNGINLTPEDIGNISGVGAALNLIFEARDMTIAVYQHLKLTLGRRGRPYH